MKSNNLVTKTGDMVNTSVRFVPSLGHLRHFQGKLCGAVGFLALHAQLEALPRGAQGAEAACRQGARDRSSDFTGELTSGKQT